MDLSPSLSEGEGGVEWALIQNVGLETLTEITGVNKISHMRRKILKWYKLLFFNVLML